VSMSSRAVLPALAVMWYGAVSCASSKKTIIHTNIIVPIRTHMHASLRKGMAAEARGVELRAPGAQQRVMAAEIRRSVVPITIGLFLLAWTADHGSCLTCPMPVVGKVAISPVARSFPDRPARAREDGKLTGRRRGPCSKPCDSHSRSTHVHLPRGRKYAAGGRVTVRLFAKRHRANQGVRVESPAHVWAPGG